MNKDISLSDWHRLLFGRAPAAMLLEVALRTLVFYLFLLVIVRLLGKRMSGQLSNLELAVMTTLGAIAAPPMQIADRGLLIGAVLLLVLLGLQRGLSSWTSRSRRAERLAFGRTSMLVRDGEISLPAMKQAQISHEQLFAVLRARGIRHLGEIRRVYFEAMGLFSVFKASTPKPGLALAPRADVQMQHALRFADHCACGLCGRVVRGRPEAACENCGGRQWRTAASAEEHASGGKRASTQQPLHEHAGAR